MFVKTMRQEYYPISRIAKLWTETRENKFTVEWAEIQEVGVAQLFYGEIERIAELGSPVVPANPGFHVLEVCDAGSSEVSLTKEPVLGWLISGDRGTVPITIEGVNHGQDKTLPILIPDGRVIVSMNGEYESEEEYLAGLRDA